MALDYLNEFRYLQPDSNTAMTTFFEPVNLLTLLPVTAMPEKFEPGIFNANTDDADTLHCPEAWRILFDMNQVSAGPSRGWQCSHSHFSGHLPWRYTNLCLCLPSFPMSSGVHRMGQCQCEGSTGDSCLWRGTAWPFRRRWWVPVRAEHE